MIVQWLPRAIDNLAKFIGRIAEENPVAAVELRDQIRAKADQLAEHPAPGKPGRRRGTREAVVTKNYLIVYRLTETQLQILRVLHARQQWP